jgi:hypothetical protein
MRTSWVFAVGEQSPLSRPGKLSVGVDSFHAGWKLRREPDGTVIWMSVAGHEYRQRPRSQLDP